MTKFSNIRIVRDFEKNWRKQGKKGLTAIPVDKSLTFIRLINHVTQEAVGSLITLYPLLNKRSALRV